MDRGVVYTGAVPLEQDFLYPQRSTMVGLGKIAEAVFGTQTMTDGLSVVPTAPASMAVRIEPGQIYSLAALDAIAYGVLPADTTHQIVKQGIMLDPLTVPITAPGTPGYSQWFLLQAAFQEQEAGAVVLPYYNSNNPAQAYSGPGNSGEAQYTQRNGRVIIQTKAGAPAATGSQPVPAADPGWTALAWVSVSNGQTSIQAQHISPAVGRRRVSMKLPDMAAALGTRATFVRAPTTLNTDNLGLVVIDLGAFVGNIDVTLPPANALGGIPMRVMVSGRYVTTPAGPNPGSGARILPPPGHTVDFGVVNIGIGDSAELVSDGQAHWHWISPKPQLNSTRYLTFAQVLPPNIATVVQVAPSTPGYFEHTTQSWTYQISQPARYRFYGQCHFEIAPTNGRAVLYAMVNGSIPMGNTETHHGVPAGSSWVSTVITPPVFLRAGDTVQMVALQTFNGSNLALRPAGTKCTLEAA